MYRPSANIDRRLSNGRFPIPADTRDYNAPVTGSHPESFPVTRERDLTYPTDRKPPWRVR